MKNIFLAATVLGGLLLAACNPNEDIYSKLDDAKKPFTEQGVAYTINDADYSLAGNKTITANKAFNDSLLPDVFVPKILAKKFLALTMNSTVKVTYNYTVIKADTSNVIFGYTLVNADYTTIGGDAAKYFNFSSNQLPKSVLPAYLPTLYPSAITNDTINVVYKYYNGRIFNWADTYKKLDAGWVYVRTYENPYMGYKLTNTDYSTVGFDVANKKYFMTGFPIETYVPPILSQRFPYVIAGTVIGVRYNYGVTSKVNPVTGKKDTLSRIEKFTFTNGYWTKEASTVTRSALYINTPTGWIFDPSTRFVMIPKDYEYILGEDKNHKDAKNGFQYGSSIQFNNISFNATDWKGVSATDNPIAGIFTGLSDDQVKAKIVEQVQKGLILLLQHNYPDAQPIVKGVDSYYYVTFTAYKGTAPILTYKFQCTAAGSPATFVFVEAVQ